MTISSTPGSSQQSQQTITIDDDDSINSSGTKFTSESNLVVSALFEPLQNGRRKCKQCDSSLKNVRGTKSGLVNHFKNLHKPIWDETIRVAKLGEVSTLVQGSMQPAITKSLLNVVVQDQFNDAILRWIIKDQQSYRVIEKILSR